MLKGLYGITSDSFLQQSEQQILLGIKASCSAGLNILQYRQKTTKKISVTCLKNIQSICKQYQTLFIINDNIDLAIQLSADGVHLGKDDPNIKQCRQQMDKNFIIGASCYNSVSTATIAEKDGASYVAFGAMFASTTKPDAPLASMSTLQHSKKNLSIPSCVIGGINQQNISLLIGKANMFAVVSGIFNQPDIFQATANLVKTINLQT